MGQDMSIKKRVFQKDNKMSECGQDNIYIYENFTIKSITFYNYSLLKQYTTVHNNGTKF